MMRPAARRGLAAPILLGLIYLLVIGAGFVAPYDPLAHDREFSYAPPTRLHFVDRSGSVHLRPFTYAVSRRSGTLDQFEEDTSRPYFVRFFVRRDPHGTRDVFGSERHLFGVEAPARLFVLGTDEYGRDVFSRFLHGGRISLLAGLLGAILSLTLGLLLGTAAGFFGSWVDDVVMRTGELFLALPWIYLLLAVRVLLPLHITTGQTFLLLIAVIAAVGWAEPARTIRDTVMSARTREYVLAARSLGASNRHVLFRHVLPQLSGLLLTHAANLVPQFTLAEVTLSFFGLGVAEPSPSWGNLLGNLQRYHVIASYWWLLIPGLALIPVFLLYYVLADRLHRRRAFSQ